MSPTDVLRYVFKKGLGSEAIENSLAGKQSKTTVGLFWKSQKIDRCQLKAKRRVRQCQEVVGSAVQQKWGKNGLKLHINCWMTVQYIVKMAGKESKNWSQFEDNVLRELREQRGIKKWSVISQKMEEEFKIIGKSGKKCRERYQSQLSKEVKRDEWTEEEQLALVRLHNQKGNKWVEIARVLQRSDNAVKNHYHSKLRKALRKINFLISTYLRGEFKPLKDNIISKILQTAQNHHNLEGQDESPNTKLCYTIKNKLLDYLGVREPLGEEDIVDLRGMIKEINQFNKVFKRKCGVKHDCEKQNYRSGRYKGKQILNLINENKNKLKEENESVDLEEEEQEESEQVEVSRNFLERNRSGLASADGNQQNEFYLSRQPEAYYQAAMRNSFPSYQFSFYGSPSMFQIFSYNMLMGERSPLSFLSPSQMTPGSEHTRLTFEGQVERVRDCYGSQKYLREEDLKKEEEDEKNQSQEGFLLSK